jgi:predicted ATPase
MPPDQQRRRVLDALIRWVRRLAVDAPTVIAFEDLQWFDPTTLELLRSLVASIHDRRICLLLTARTPFEPPWDRQPNELRLVLNPLTRAEAQALVTSIAAEHTVPEPILRDVLARSDGVPLFLEEVTRMLVDAPQGIASVPETLQDLLAARLDRLPSSVVDTIQIAAVVGRQFTRELLLAASTKDSGAVAADVSALLASGIVQDERGGLSFKHVLLRDSVYQRMLRGRRREVHARIASTLLDGFPHVAATQPELVAHHLTEAGAADAAFREWSRAGRRSLGNGAYREAAHHFEQALAVRYQRDPGGDDRQIAELQEELGVRKDFGVSLIATQGYTSPAVADNYARALRLSATAHQRDADIPIPVLYGLWGTCLVRGDREATGALARHFDRARHSDDPLTRHVACSALGALAFYEGRFQEARRHCEEAMRLYRPADHFVLLRDYGFEGGIYSQLYVACILCFTGHPDRGLGVVRQALEVANSLGDPHARAMSLALAACIARERREPAEAARLSDDLVALAAEQHFIMWLGIAHCLRGWSRLTDGDVAGGSREIREGLATWEATGAKVPGTYLRLTLVEAALASGDLDGALAVVEQGLTQCRETLESYQAPEYHRLKGEILVRKHDVRAAEGEFCRALAEAHAQGATWLELRAALSLGRLAAHAPVADAPARLADVVSRIGDGALTPDMREARAMLSPSP